MHLNTHGLVGKQTELKFLNKELSNANLDPDVILLCETFLNEKNCSQVELHGYVHLHKYRTLKRGGRVSILLRCKSKKMPPVERCRRHFSTSRKMLLAASFNQ